MSRGHPDTVQQSAPYPDNLLSHAPAPRVANNYLNHPYNTGADVDAR